jgi:membrane protein YdbS with pleckstrin-like domain
MDNFDDLKTVWHTAKTDRLPTSKEMLKLISTFRNEKLRNKWLMICSCLLFSSLIIAVLFFVSFRLTTTYIGGGLMVISGLLVTVTNIRSLKRFKQLDNCSNLEFIKFIEQTRQNQIYYYKKTMVSVVVLCSVGWLMYLYEFISKYPIWLFAIYSVAIIYLAVLWFIIRPRSFNKDAAKLVATREKLETILKQLNNK